MPMTSTSNTRTSNATTTEPDAPPVEGVREFPRTHSDNEAPGSGSSGPSQ